MHSTWWPALLSSFPQDDNERAETSTSFRLPKASSSHSSASDSHRSSKSDKKVSKRKSRKDSSKSKRNKKQTDSKANPHIRFGVLHDTIPTVGSEEDREAMDKQSSKEHCKVVNLKIPLPMQSEVFSLHHLKQTEQISKLKSLQGVESPRSFRRKNSCTEEENRTRQPVLKSVELVNFANEDQSPYVQHQRTLTKSSCITVPALANSSILVNLTHRPGSASTWKDIHPPPSPLLQHTPPRKSHPSTEYPDLVLSSKQLSSRAPYSQLNACHSVHEQMHVLRPFFRYSHRNSNSQCSARHTPSSDGCSQCLQTHLIRPSSSTLACEQGHRDRLAHNHLPGLNRELPPLEGVPSHTQGHHFVRCPHHQPSCDQKSSGGLTHYSTTSPSSKPVKEEYSYPDPLLVGGLPSYHRRLAQMGALVLETIRSEKEKSLKRKSKKSTASGPSTPRSNNNGSLGSL